MKMIFTTAIALLFSLALTGQEALKGEIIYLEGEVNISRRGEFLPAHDVDMGTQVEDEDMVRTGADGYAEIELAYPDQGTLLKIQPDTAFYFEKREDRAESVVNLTLLNGTLGLKVNKLASNQSMNVETQSAVMGIRGTLFDVNKSATGEILITCEEGRVSCSTPAMETFSYPGQICEQSDGKDFTTREVALEDLPLYREYWWKLRMDALVSLGPLAAEYYSGRYGRQVILFDDAWNALRREEKLLREYEELIIRGETVSRSQATRDKMTLTTPIIKMRSSLPLMEEVFYTMLALESYHNRGVFTGGAAYFKDFNRRKDSLERDIVRARYYLTLYGKISEMGGIGVSDSLGVFGN